MNTEQHQTCAEQIAALAEQVRLLREEVAALRNGGNGAPPNQIDLKQFRGDLDPNDPAVQEWERAMAEYRKQREVELDAL